MSGLYVHIPFCESRCIYCDFYSTTRHNIQNRYIDALCREYNMRRNEMLAKNSSWDTIYIGGGTPSTLSIENLERLFDVIGKDIDNTTKPNVSNNNHKQLPEITIECNPDDITTEYAHTLSSLPVNRISMGVQTFDDNRLRFISRRHSSHQISEAISKLHNAGFTNISIDLMYGFPDETVDDFRNDIHKALELDVPHISAYSLMYEEGTPLHRMLEQGKIKIISEDTELDMYSALVKTLTAAGYEHYEISNFAKPNHRSRHNSNYWNLTPYLGIGAAAHSFDGINIRSSNPPHLIKYIKAIESSTLPTIRENLTTKEQYNDYTMLRLRTNEGINLQKLENLFGLPFRHHTEHTAQQFIVNGLLEHDTDTSSLRLTPQGVFVSNMVMSEFMIV